jgi:hypothetical protein
MVAHSFIHVWTAEMAWVIFDQGLKILDVGRGQQVCGDELSIQKKYLISLTNYKLTTCWIPTWFLTK